MGTRTGQPLLQPHSNEITEGFSGAPVWDEVRRRVVGMIVIAAQIDRSGKLSGTAFATPTEILRTLSPALQVSDICPYRDLAAFTEADAAIFFGRQRIIEMLLDNLQNTPRFLAIFGASGSGKSSIVQAGLIPRLRNNAFPGSDRWNILVTRPTDASFKQEDLAYLDLASTPTVLIIDQFEELFVSYDEEKCAEVITQLAQLLEHSPHVTLILVMRDDFYSLLMRQERLAIWLKGGVVNVWPTLKHREIVSIVRDPAELMGWQFEEGLVDTIVNDVLATPEKERDKDESSTILPLLEFTLTQLWEKHQEGILTHDAYRRIGGVTGGLKQWANHTYYAFEERQRPLVRQIFTELIHLGDEEQHIPDSRRRRRLSMLLHSDTEENDISQIIQRLVANRLLATSQDQKSKQETIEIIHDALLWEWGLLKQWVDEDRIFLRWRQGLERQAQAWIEKRDTDKLLRGTDLMEAKDYLDKRFGELNHLEREFIQASKQRKRFERQRRTLIVGGGGVILGLALLGGPTATAIENFINTTFFEKQNLLKSVEALVPNINIDEYTKVFGNPTLVNVVEQVKNVKEYIFVTNYFYLDAVTDRNNVVLYYAVTIRDKTFNPVFKSPGYPASQPSVQVTLGVSKLKDIDQNFSLNYLTSCVGIHDFYYYELYYFGNPGLYESFGFGVNEAGYLSEDVFDALGSLGHPIIDLCPIISPTGEPQATFPTVTTQDLEKLQVFRAKAIINTYAVSSPNVSISDYVLWNLGVDYNQVRTLQK